MSDLGFGVLLGILGATSHLAIGALRAHLFARGRRGASLALAPAGVLLPVALLWPALALGRSATIVAALSLIGAHRVALWRISR